ncbi:MAG TPA: SEC-C metal-binding domain-containing protein, partial [Streptosporangiaceae bacterium]
AAAGGAAAAGAQNGRSRGGARARGRDGQPNRAGQAQPASGPHAAGAAPAGPAGGTPTLNAPGLARPQRPGRLSYSAPSVDGGAQVQSRTEISGDGDFGKVGRNAPCPCGSGRKYKLCHGDPRNRPAG